MAKKVVTTRYTQTRIKLTWFGAIALTIITIIAVLLKLESVATVGIPSIAGMIMGYQGSQAYTKAQFIKTNSQNNNLEG